MPGKNKYNHSQQAFFQQNGRIDRIIGDKKRPDLFRDCVELKFNYKWSNEFKGSWLLLTERMYDEPESAKTVDEKDGVITTKTNLIENKYFDIGEEATEHEFILYQCPKKGVVPISFLGKGLDLYFQPGLDKEYKAGWSNFFKTEIDVTPTYVMDTKTGLYLMNRPIEYVNSYAIFNNQGLANHIINPLDGLDVNYGFGKVGHLHAYCMYLPDGKKIWLESYLEKGIIYVKIPDEYIKDESLWKAGVRFGPTFGYTTAGASSTSFTSARCFKGASYIYTASSGDTITGFSIYASGSGSPTVGMAAYTISGGVPVDRLAAAQNITIPESAAWVSVTGLSQSLTAGVAYGCAQGNMSFGFARYYDLIGTGTQSVHNTNNLDATWSESLSSSNAFSSYATYKQAATFTPKVFFIN